MPAEATAPGRQPFRAFPTGIDAFATGSESSLRFETALMGIGDPDGACHAAQSGRTCFASGTMARINLHDVEPVQTVGEAIMARPLAQIADMVTEYLCPASAHSLPPTAAPHLPLPFAHAPERRSCLVEHARTGRCPIDARADAAFKAGHRPRPVSVPSALTRRRRRETDRGRQYRVAASSWGWIGVRCDC